MDDYTVTLTRKEKYLPRIMQLDADIEDLTAALRTMATVGDRSKKVSPAGSRAHLGEAMHALMASIKMMHEARNALLAGMPTSSDVPS